MTEDNVLAIPENLPQQSFDSKDLLAVSAGGDFLPRLQVIGAKSNDFAEGKVKNIGVYALIRDKERTEELTAELDCLLVRARPMALDTGDNTHAVYDRSDPEFQRIQAESRKKDSNCMYGPQFLVWLPSKDEFCTLFLGSWSARKEGPGALTLMDKGRKTPDGKTIFDPTAARLSVFLDSSGNYKWHRPQIRPCTTPLPPSTDPEWNKKLIDEINKFDNPPKNVVEKATVPADDRAR